MEIKINQEIKEYNETMFFGLSVRQFIFAILACASAVGIYFGCRSFMGTENVGDTFTRAIVSKSAQLDTI